MQNDVPNIPIHLHISAQIYYNMNFITSSSNFSTRLPWVFEINLHRLLLKDYCFSTQKMHVSEYVCKTCLKIRHFVKIAGKPLENFLQTATLLRILAFTNQFLTFFDILYFKNTNFLTKTKTCLLC